MLKKKKMLTTLLLMPIRRMRVTSTMRKTETQKQVTKRKLRSGRCVALVLILYLLRTQEILQAIKASMPAELEDAELMEDSDPVPSDLDSDEELDEEQEPEEKSAEEISAEEESAEAHQDEDEGDDFDLAEGSDAEDLLPLDADIPSGLIAFDGPVSEAEKSDEWGGIDGSASKKRKRSDHAKNQRKKLKSLPTFASYEDYAKLIEDGPEDNI